MYGAARVVLTAALVAMTCVVPGGRMAAATRLAGSPQALAHEPLQLTTHLYRVQQGDTVVGIARHSHDMIWLMRRRNGGLWRTAPGALIWVWDWPFDVPRVLLRTRAIDHPRYYTVRAGDSLSVIAGRLGTTVQDLAAQNGLGSGDLIYPGQRLVLHQITWRVTRTVIPGLSLSSLPRGLLLTDVAALVGLDPALFKALVWHESGWRMERGGSGEIGMVQIMPRMARWVQQALVGYPLDPNVPANNAFLGALLLAYYLDANHGNVARALGMYHSGYTTLDARNRAYVRAVLGLRAYFTHHPRSGF